MRFNKKSREFYKQNLKKRTQNIDFSFNERKSSKIGAIIALVFIFSIPIYAKTFEISHKKTQKKVMVAVKVNHIKKELPKEEIKESPKKEEPKIEKKPEEKIYKVPKKIKKIKKKEEPKKDKPIVEKVQKKEEFEKRPEEKPIEQKDVWGMNADSFAKNSIGNGVAIKAGNSLDKEYDTIEVDKNSIPQKIEEPKFDETKEYDSDEVTIAPKFLKRVPPKYTSEALEDEIEGVVVLSAIINNNGSIISVKIKKKLGYGLDEEAIKALKNSKLSPAKIGEYNVKCVMEFKYRFKINYK
ncbi:TonB family protein [bacterium]|nr:TonB family protein [bacterium]